MPEKVGLLSERLAAAGYQAALFTTNANVSARFGFDQGWEELQSLSRGIGRGRREHSSASEINREVFAWLEGILRRHELAVGYL